MFSRSPAQVLRKLKNVLFYFILLHIFWERMAWTVGVLRKKIRFLLFWFPISVTSDWIATRKGFRGRLCMGCIIIHTWNISLYFTIGAIVQIYSYNDGKDSHCALLHCDPDFKPIAEARVLYIVFTQICCCFGWLPKSRAIAICREGVKRRNIWSNGVSNGLTLSCLKCDNEWSSRYTIML